MQSSGIGLRDYERLPADVKTKAVTLFEGLKAELLHRGFSLSFLGHDGRWKDLTAWKFLAFPEDHYQKLIRGAKLVRPRQREDLLEQISELYDLAKQSPRLEDRSLEFWSKETSST
ncbi:MAG: hypothetical protein ABSD41_04920 [Candidatus Bathyarchaeia archaeon]|jgi:hypothetical protein